MRSIVHDRFGDPATVLGVRDMPMPTPGAGQVRVRTTLAAIHNHDTATVKGVYGYKPDLPAIGGTEATGVVDAAGDGVALAVGQRVTVAGVPGTWAEYVVADVQSVVPLPDEIDDQTGAQLIAMPLSTLMLLNTLDVPKGQWVVQNAANGAVGVMLAMMARARGVRVLNLVRRSAAVDEMQALSIDDVVATDLDDWKDRAKSVIGDGHVAAAVDSVGGTSTNDLLDLLGTGGTLWGFGSMAAQPMSINGGTLLFKDAVVRGFWASRLRQTMSAEERSALIAELIRLVQTGDIRLPVGGIFAFEAITDAIKAHGTPGRGGKILLKP